MAKKKNVVIMLGLVLSTLMSTAVKAEGDEMQERQRLLGIIKSVVSDEAKNKAALEKGHDRSMLCSHCHGEDGNSKRPDIPNLAGQNPDYLLEQIDMFADGRRKNFVMNTLTKDFTAEDRINLSVYYSEQKVKPQDFDPGKASHGERIYQTVCVMCHGTDGHGNQGFARIAGQQIEFVQLTLKRFRTNATNPDPTRKVKRSNQRMEQVTANLTDADITGLAHFIASLK